MTDLSSYAIQNQRQISSHLFLLVKNKCLLSARFGINGESYVTTLLGIDEKNNTLFFDCGPKNDVNNIILHADKIRFDTQYRGIQIWFTATALKKTIHKGAPAFIMPIPKKLFWMERRGYYRVKMPPSNLSYCQLLQEDKEPINIKIHDISLSGFSMLSVHKDIFDQMILGALFEQGKLIFLDAGEDRVSFEVRYNHIINPPAQLQGIQKIGCKFINMTSSVEDAIQRYMLQIQREDLKGHEPYTEL